MTSVLLPSACSASVHAQGITGMDVHGILLLDGAHFEVGRNRLQGDTTVKISTCVQRLLMKVASYLDPNKRGIGAA